MIHQVVYDAHAAIAVSSITEFNARLAFLIRDRIEEILVIKDSSFRCFIRSFISLRFILLYLKAQSSKRSERRKEDKYRRLSIFV